VWSDVKASTILYPGLFFYGWQSYHGRTVPTTLLFPLLPSGGDLIMSFFEGLIEAVKLQFDAFYVHKVR